MNENPSPTEGASYGCILGGLFGAFVFPILWMIALYSIPVYEANGERVKNPGTLLATMVMIPLGIAGCLGFGLLGALIGYVVRRVKANRRRKALNHE